MTDNKMEYSVVKVRKAISALADAVNRNDHPEVKRYLEETIELFLVTLTVDMLKACGVSDIKAQESIAALIQNTRMMCGEKYKEAPELLCSNEFENFKKDYYFLVETDKHQSYWCLLAEAGAQSGNYKLLNEVKKKIFEFLSEAKSLIERQKAAYIDSDKFNKYLSDKESAFDKIIDNTKAVADRRDENIRLKKENAKGKKQIATQRLKKRLIKIICIYLASILVIGAASMFIRGPVKIFDVRSTAVAWYHTMKNDPYSKWDFHSYIESISIKGDDIEIVEEFKDFDGTTGTISQKLEPYNAFGKSSIKYEDGTRGWIKIKYKDYHYEVFIKYHGRIYCFEKLGR